MHASPSSSRRARPSALLTVAAFAILGNLLPATAQDRTKDQGPKVVYMVINAPASASRKEIERTFEQAKSGTDAMFNYDAILMERIDVEVFGLLNSIVKHGVDAVRDLRDTGDREGIQQLAGESNAWVVTLGKGALIGSATIGIAGVAVEGMPAEKSVEVEVGKPAGETGVAIVGHSPGRYVVKTQPRVQPMTFRCKATDLSGAKRDFAAEFPATDTGVAYLVTLNGFVGETKSLFDALADGTCVANPVQEINDVPLIVANFVPQPMTDFEFVDGVLQFTQPVDKEHYPKRLWLFFAATGAEREAERHRVTAEEFTEIPRLIREKRVNLADPATALNAKGGWVEIKPLITDPTTGAKRFQVGVRFDLPAWKQAVKNAATDASEEILMVYEFGADGEPSPIKVRGSGYVVTKKLLHFVRAVTEAK